MMDISSVVDWSREALRMALMLAGPILLAALAAGLVIGAIQAMTQMHEQSVAQVPRLIVVIAVVLMALPWLVSMWVGYAVETIGSIPGRI